MSQAIVSEIEKNVLALPLDEQRRLIARVSEMLRKQSENEDEFNAQLVEMAKDENIQRELIEIEQDFQITEFDGLAE